MGVKLKNWRHSTKVNLGIQRGDTPETVRARVGARRLSNYRPEDVDALLNKWCDEEYQEYADHMKQLRALQNTPHCTGTKSYARLSHEETVKDGTPPTRAQAYIKTHKKKDGSYPNDIVKERCDGDANANRLCRIVKRNTRNGTLET
ncbi:uncharacterized protein LOC133878974 [Alnus glutinosa]|uniref:uncharacterized protein LOC133878974 n=1 Tax=Alnus glutinosa TaxID=3517 RepID=UPI002D773AB7|nr:uncharacterized protein LOC133878974 [Alnus glutinosa]